MDYIVRHALSVRDINAMGSPLVFTDQKLSQSLHAANKPPRQPARAPLPTSRQLDEQRRKRFFKRVSDDRRDKQFDKRADHMMYSAHLQDQEQWLLEMEQAAKSVRHEEEEDETDNAMDLPDVPPEVEDEQGLNIDDLAAIHYFSGEQHPPGDEAVSCQGTVADYHSDVHQLEEHFGSDDETEEFRMLLSQVAQECEKMAESRPSQDQVEHMDTS